MPKELKYQSSIFRFCKRHDTYYLEGEDATHSECEAQDKGKPQGELTTWELRNDEVLYYLNKLKHLRTLFNQLRTELL